MFSMILFLEEPIIFCPKGGKRSLLIYFLQVLHKNLTYCSQNWIKVSCNFHLINCIFFMFLLFPNYELKSSWIALKTSKVLWNKGDKSPRLCLIYVTFGDNRKACVLWSNRFFPVTIMSSSKGDYPISYTGVAKNQHVLDVQPIQNLRWNPYRNLTKFS